MVSITLCVYMCVYVYEEGGGIQDVAPNVWFLSLCVYICVCVCVFVGVE